MPCLAAHSMPLQRAAAPQRLCRWQPFASQPGQPRFVRARSSTEEATTTSSAEAPGEAPKAEQDGELDKQIQRFTRQTASTFAPRPSTAQKNPAVRGSTLYWIFEYQAWIAMAAGALLSYNLLFPTDGPAIPRLLGCAAPLPRASMPPAAAAAAAAAALPPALSSHAMPCPGVPQPPLLLLLLPPPGPASTAPGPARRSPPPTAAARARSMWSVWMFTIPSLRAKECLPKEKDALNLLFVLVPFMNVTLPFVWKSFPFIFTMDVVALLGIYYAKGVWKEVYGLPIEPPNSS
jgi:hypothetical protein